MHRVISSIFMPSSSDLLLFVVLQDRFCLCGLFFYEYS